jgi:mannose-6-phosphate isomerase-like protein (cupin superfamily)
MPAAMSIDAFQVDDLIARLAQGQHDFAEFFRARKLSLTIASWPAGAVDDQQPHAEDEVYYVVRGRAALRVGVEATPVEPGSVVYVPAGAAHQFVDIEADLAVVVFWSPPRARPT